MRAGCILAALVAAAALSACEREPTRTVVIPPQASLPDDAALRSGSTPAVPKRPRAAAPAAGDVGSETLAKGKEPAAATAPPADAPGQLPLVRNMGDREGAQLLAQRPLAVPVAGVAPTALADHFEQSRGSRKHEAIDILAPSGTPVVAVDDGAITKLFTSKAGGLTVYQYDPAGKLTYYYAHLQRYADGLREGMTVRRGDVIGYVGTSGNANPQTPHLHFAVFRLGSPPRWWQGEPVNPYPALSRAQPVQQVASR